MGNIQSAKPYLQWINETIRLDSLANSAKGRKVYRGQVYWCCFGINIGSEQSDKRPCVIIQNDKGNLSSPNTIVAPITHTNSTLDIVVPISDKFDGSGNLILDGHVLLGNILTISKSRLENFITSLSKNEMKKVDEAILKSAGIFSIVQQLEKRIEGQQRHIDNLDRDMKIKNESIQTLEAHIEELKKEVEALKNLSNINDYNIDKK